MRLANEKVRLIAVEEPHWAYIYHWANSGDYEHFFGDYPPLSSLDCMKLNKAGKLYMIVNPAKIEDVYGLIMVTNIQERHRNVHYHILVDKKYQKSSIGFEASKMAIGYILNGLNMFKVIALSAEDNPGSKALIDKLGFEFEGKLKQDVYINGEFKDLIRYRMTKGPFNKKYKKELDGSKE